MIRCMSEEDTVLAPQEEPVLTVEGDSTEGDSGIDVDIEEDTDDSN